ncbi:hypothetical protein CPE01_00520 [Cellulomonas persica]|uniref:Uncharacterized protein n=1 Tax=Cellulomonas persica TaxID=76861 RepID=A0A510UP48_9CELL|nr:hypothetical protein CPE01_00520 [Cellulomonas persica]
MIVPPERTAFASAVGVHDLAVPLPTYFTVAAVTGPPAAVTSDEVVDEPADVSAAGAAAGTATGAAEAGATTRPVTPRASAATAARRARIRVVERVGMRRR